MNVLLLAAVLTAPPIAPPFAAVVAPPFQAPLVVETTHDPRPGAILHRTRSGASISIVPEEPHDRLVTVTQMVSQCGMGCCLAPVTRQVRVKWNGPTPLDKLEQGLALAKLTRDDVLYDLGSGDGRVAILAAKAYGCRAVGLDTRAEAVELAKANAKASGVERLVRFYVADAAAANLDQATAVYSHLDAPQAGLIGRVVKRFPSVRVAIAYQHKPPTLATRKIGDFYVWLSD